MQQPQPEKQLALQNLDSLVQLLKINKNYKEALKYGAANYNINLYKINKLKLQEMSELVNLIEVNYINLQKELSQNQTNKKQAWLANELKLFVWMAVCHSFLSGKALQNYKTEDWQYFTFILARKNREDLQFQIKSIFKNYHGNKQKWDEQEEQLLKGIIDQEKFQNKWNDISRLLYFRSNKKYYRSAQKCREHWFNHLDPMLNKNPWTLEEDLRLIRQLQASGFKWSKLTQLIEIKWGYRRTQHMVKNRAKLLCKKFGYKDEKEQGCLKELSIIEKKLTEEVRKQLKQKTIQKQHQVHEQGLKVLNPYKISSLYQLSFKERNSQLFHNKKVNNQYKSSQNSEEESQIKSQVKSQVISCRFSVVQSEMNKKEVIKQQKAGKKRNVIILYQAQKGKNKQKQNLEQNLRMKLAQKQQIDDSESPQIMIGKHVEEQPQNMSQNQEPEKEQSYYDQYHIIEEVPNQNIDFNRQIQFNHDAHGGRMRERVTHELAQFFSNVPKESQNA